MRLIDAVGNMLRRKFGIGGDLAEITLAGLPSAEPERKKPDHGYLWICPECGLEVHSDFTRCVRCGWDRPSADMTCDGCMTPKHICGICMRNYPNITDHYCTGEAWREVKDETAV